MLRSAAVREVSVEYASLAVLMEELEANGDEQELTLTEWAGLRDGDWVLASVVVGECSTSAAARVVVRNGEVAVSFVERDWDALLQFANGEARVSIPPSLRPPSCEALAPQGSQVLVIDDDQALQQMLRCVLGTAGVKVTALSSVETAMDWLRQNEAHLILLDSGVGGLGATEFCRRLRRDRSPARAALPVLLLCAGGTCREESLALDAGVNDIVDKPFRAPELRVRVVNLLRRRAADELRLVAEA